MKAMWAGQSNVLVSVRVRPLMKHDVVKKSCVRVLDSKVVVILDPAAQKPDVLRVNRTREKQYAFDYVFEPSSSQEATYHHTTKFLIHGVLDGFNATVFAYGQTGSGKTFTMIGMQENPGIMVRVMSDLFVHSANNAKANAVNHKVSVSFLEVYNENIRDLLGVGESAEEYLDLREDPIKGPVVAGITEVEANSAGEIMQLLHQGNAKRSQAATAANEVSSRSHAVLQVVVESRDRAPGVVDNIKVGKLSLIDLAGSERAANTQNRGARLVEGANINRSLLALGNCINALGEKGNKGNFVPYRDSKLTRLLKDSLGGNCRTVMIANISPAESSFEETLNTLKYANRAKNIKTEAKRNVLNVNYHISEYVELINNLRGEIKMLKDQIEINPIGPSSPLRVAVGSPGGGAGDGSHMGNLRPRGMAHLDIQSANDPNNRGISGHSLSPTHAGHLNPSTPMQALRASLRSGGQAGGAFRGQTAGQGENRELVNSMRQMIVSNFQERMQLRRSLIELEDQNVQNSIEVSKRQLIVVQWTESVGVDGSYTDEQDLGAYIVANAPPDVASSWRECEQIRKAVLKNNSMKRSIAKRLRHNEREAERVRDELGDKITGEDRRELMELQYQVGRLELENMELEQHRIVHESILKGKDLVIQKLKLQLAVKDKMIARQQAVLVKHNLQGEVGYQQLAILENSLNNTLSGGGSGSAITGDGINPFGNTASHQNGYADSYAQNMHASSPPRSIGALGVGTYVGAHRLDLKAPNAGGNNKYPITQQRLDQSEAAKSKGKGQGLDTSLEGSYTSLEFEGNSGKDADDGFLLLEEGGNGNGKAHKHNHGPMFTSLAEPRAIVPGNGREGGGGGKIGLKADCDRERDRKEERDKERQAVRERPDDPTAPTSHHFYPSAQAGSGNAVVPAPQGAMIIRNERPRKRPMHKPDLPDRPTPSGFNVVPTSGGAGGGGGAGPKASPRADMGMEILGKSNNPNPNPSAAVGGNSLLGPGPGPRRAKPGYVPSSWEAKPIVQPNAAEEVDKAASSRPSGKVSPIGILPGNAAAVGGGNGAPVYQNSSQALSQAQASMMLARQQQQQQQQQQQVGSGEARDRDRNRDRDRTSDRESKQNDDGFIDTPQFSISKAEPGPPINAPVNPFGEAPSSIPVTINRADSERHPNHNNARHTQSESSLPTFTGNGNSGSSSPSSGTNAAGLGTDITTASSGDLFDNNSQRQQQSGSGSTKAEVRRRPMGAQGAARQKAPSGPRAGLQNDSSVPNINIMETGGSSSKNASEKLINGDLEEGSAETVYSEEDSDSSFTKEVPEPPAGIFGGRSTPPAPLTSADRAQQAAQAQVAAHAEALALAQQQQKEQASKGLGFDYPSDSKKNSVLGKLRKGSNRNSSGGSGKDAKGGDVYDPSNVNIAINVGNNIISGGISQAQRRAEAGAGGGGEAKRGTAGQRPKPRLNEL